MINADICIHGSGFVGQTLALLLAKAGLRVVLISSDRAPDVTDVRAFALNAASKDLLEHIHAWPAQANAVTPVVRMHVIACDGASDALTHGKLGHLHFTTDSQHCHFTPAAEDKPSPPFLNWMVHVPALVESLQNQVAQCSGLTVRDSVQGVQAKVHVLCEGRDSKRVNAAVTQPSIQAYEQHALAARVRLSTPHAQCARQWFHPEAEILALLPVGGVGSDEAAIVWSQNSVQAHRRMGLAPEDFCQELERLCGQPVALCSPRALWPLQWKQTQTWCGLSHALAPLPVSQSSQTESVWVLAGDAAHTVHPMAGQGLNLGLGDAKMLSAVLVDSWSSTLDNDRLLRHLRHYARARKAAAWAVGQVTDGLHMLFACDQPAIKHIRAWGFSGFDRFHVLKKAVTMAASQ